MLGPVVSGPNAQMDRAASKSQSYLVWKNSPRRFLDNEKNKNKQVEKNTTDSLQFETSVNRTYFSIPLAKFPL